MVGLAIYWLFIVLAGWAIYRQFRPRHIDYCKSCGGVGTLYDSNGHAIGKCEACRGSGRA